MRAENQQDEQLISDYFHVSLPQLQGCLNAPNCQPGILSSLSNEKDAWLFASFVHGFHKPEGNDIDLEAVGQEFCL